MHPTRQLQRSLLGLITSSNNRVCPGLQIQMCAFPIPIWPILNPIGMLLVVHRLVEPLLCQQAHAAWHVDGAAPRGSSLSRIVGNSSPPGSIHTASSGTMNTSQWDSLQLNPSLIVLFPTHRTVSLAVRVLASSFNMTNIGDNGLYCFGGFQNSHLTIVWLLGRPSSTHTGFLLCVRFSVVVSTTHFLSIYPTP